MSNNKGLASHDVIIDTILADLQCNVFVIIIYSFLIVLII